MKRSGRNAWRSRTRARLVIAGLAIGLTAAACVPPPAPGPAPVQDPLTLGRSDALGNDAATGASVSADGSWVAFSSLASNLVPGDTNDAQDSFLRSRTSGSVVRVRERTIGTPNISENGRFVSYRTTGGMLGVYDPVSREHTEWQSTVSSPATPVVPADGSVAIYGAYSSFGIFATACRVRDLAAGVESDCPALGPGFGTRAFDAVSSNGRFVLYYWLDQDGGGTSARVVWDRLLDSVTPVPMPILVLGSSASISDDGRTITTIDVREGAPWSAVVHDLEAGTSTPVPGDPTDGNTIPLDISADGSRVLLLSESETLVPGDTNGAADVFIWDVPSESVTRISARLDDGAELPNGAFSCGNGPGQLLADGSAGCVRTSDPLVAFDTNGVADAYLAG